jgi:hypothetical protein
MTDIQEREPEGETVGPRDDGQLLTPMTMAELEALGLELPPAPPEEDEPQSRGLTDGSTFRVRGQFGGYGLLGQQGRRFKVMSNPDSKEPDLVGKFIEVVVRAGWEWLINYVAEQAKQREIVITDLELQRVGEHYELIDASTEWPMSLELSTVWNDTVVVFLGQTPYKFQPGENYSGTIHKRVQGPNAKQRGWAHVRIINTAGKGIEVIGNWSIDVTFKLSLGGKAIAQGHFNGYEPRGWARDYGPFYFGALD